MAVVGCQPCRSSVSQRTRPGRSTHRSEKTSIMSSRVRTVLVRVRNSLRMSPTRMIEAIGAVERKVEEDKEVQPACLERGSARERRSGWRKQKQRAPPMMVKNRMQMSTTAPT